MVSKRGQAVLISLHNAFQQAGGQNSPADCFEGRRPRQWQERLASASQYHFFAGNLQFGALAQLGERLICIQEVIGSIPIGSTRLQFAWQIVSVKHGSVAQVVRAHA